MHNASLLVIMDNSVQDTHLCALFSCFVITVDVVPQVCLPLCLDVYTFHVYT